MMRFLASCFSFWCFLLGLGIDMLNTPDGTRFQ